MGFSYGIIFRYLRTCCEALFPNILTRHRPFNFYPCFHTDCGGEKSSGIIPHPPNAPHHTPPTYMSEVGWNECAFRQTPRKQEIVQVRECARRTLSGCRIPSANHMPSLSLFPFPSERPYHVRYSEFKGALVSSSEIT
jgi:hypothetical protein